MASSDPDHRRAARLLQAIDGEAPAPSLERVARPRAPVVEPPVAEPPVEAPPAVAPPVAEPVGEVAVGPEVGTAAAPSDDDRIDDPPKLSELPHQSPVADWYANVAELAKVPTKPQPSLHERVFGPELLLLSERPPAPVTTEGLVFLTRLELRVGDDPDSEVLELVGGGTVELEIQPLDGHRVRLWVLGAGAVPAFLASRPHGSAVEVTAVRRDASVVEIELELSYGWTLRRITGLDNGAAVELARTGAVSP